MSHDDIPKIVRTVLVGPSTRILFRGEAPNVIEGEPQDRVRTVWTSFVSPKHERVGPGAILGFMVEDVPPPPARIHPWLRQGLAALVWDFAHRAFGASISDPVIEPSTGHVLSIDGRPGPFMLTDGQWIWGLPIDETMRAMSGHRLMELRARPDVAYLSPPR